MPDVIRKRFETPDETHHSPKGSFDVTGIGSMTIRRALPLEGSYAYASKP